LDGANQLTLPTAFARNDALFEAVMARFEFPRWRRAAATAARDAPCHDR